MDAVLTALITQLNSSVFVLIAILVFTIIAAFKIGGWKQTFVNHHGRIEKVERIADNVVAIQTKVDLIYMQTNRNSPVQALSPISLTDVGRDILLKVDGENLFKEYAVRLIANVESKNPKSAYDIQQTAFAVAQKEFLQSLPEEPLNRLKQEAFSRGLPLDVLMSVFGVLLRNKILEDRKIPISEVDKTAPKI